jgi:hypothetical protein
MASFGIEGLDPAVDNDLIQRLGDWVLDGRFGSCSGLNGSVRDWQGLTGFRDSD